MKGRMQHLRAWIHVFGNDFVGILGISVGTYVNDPGSSLNFQLYSQLSIDMCLSNKFFI